MHEYIDNNYSNYFKNCFDKADKPIMFVNNTYLQDAEFSSDRNIVVTFGAELYVLDAQLKLGNNTKISVGISSKLISNHSKYTTKYCNSTWEGMNVAGNPSKKQTRYDDIYSQVSGDCGIIFSTFDTLENAIIALNTNSDQAYPAWGGLILSYGSVFRNNWKDAQFMKYKFLDFSTFWYCSFLGGNHGATIWADKGVQFDHCKFFNKKEYGIHSLYADYLIENCTFENNEIGVGAEADGYMFSKVELRYNNFKYNRYAGVDARSITLTSLLDNFICDFGTWGAKIEGGLSSPFFNKDIFNGSIGIFLNSTASPRNSRIRNLVSRSVFKSNIVGLHIVDDNSTSLFLCNNFNENIIDMAIDGRNSANPASINKNHYFNNSPDNCFGSIYGLDIWTLGNTERFQYFYDPLNMCTMPRNQGNFDLKTSIVSPFSLCDLIERENNTETRLIEINELLKINNSNDNTEKLKLEKNQLINSLIDSLSLLGDTLKINSILNNEQVSDFVNLMWLKLAFNQENYTKARYLISEIIPLTLIEKKLKLIYLDKIENKIDALSVTNYKFIKSIAVSNMPEKTFAKTLLYFIFDEVLKDNFPIFPIINDINLRTSHHVINNILISPNLISDAFKFEGLNDQNLNIANIYDLNGLLKMSFEVFNNELIDITKLGSGFYVVQISSDNTIISTQKLIKL